jgi:protein-tyrosine-phosphatase
MLDWSPTDKGGDVPDPWYGGSEGFVTVYDLLDASIDTLLNELGDVR